MTYFEAAVLGLLQGLTEFLPVSSSGHLVLGQRLLGIDPVGGGKAFEVLLHFGTVLSIATVYWRDFWHIGRQTAIACAKPARIQQSWKESEGFRMGFLIGVTMIPTGIVYLLFDDAIEKAFSSPKLAAGMLLVTAGFLFSTLLRKNPQGELSIGKAFFIGIAQSFAMIPGISRSGATIATALGLGVAREKAARFSFLMSTPVIIAATLVEIIKMDSGSDSIPWAPMVLGLAIAYVSGVFAIRAVVRVVQRDSLPYFGIYCLIAGILGLLLL